MRHQPYTHFFVIDRMKKTVIFIVAGLLAGVVPGITMMEAEAQKQAVDSVYTYRSPTRDGIGKFYMGREIAHVMGASGSAWLDRASRPQEENTQLAIDKIDVPPNAVIADIGAGTGYYTFKLVQKVPKGKVIAVEIQDELISELKARAKKLNHNNVEVIKGGTTSPNLPENSVDLAIMVDVYHELEYPVEVLQSIKKALKKNGQLLLIEYKGEDASVAIKPLHKTTVKGLNKELGANGFTLSYEGKFMPIQHFLLYKKNQ
jgi:ubiquinone/menaquinone biosynthesis C-methylase UbiE